MRFNYILSILVVFGCSQPPVDRSQLSDEQKRAASNSLSAMQIANGLEASLFASEPMLVNPTNIDIDHMGRIWVCEGYNYRLRLNPDKNENPDGDRILILEDTDQDGKADKRTVFYQGNDINSALGISVLGDKIIVSKSPDIIVFTDADGDDKPDKKEVLFSGMGAEDHDHGVHAVIFGPDGKLYFNAGNEIHQMNNPDGTPAVDLAGNQINDSGNPYRQGMAFRCNLDGSELETLGWNFRNPYELAVDSYGNIWQSDNDDDGNRGTRLNLVLEFGNYGFTDEMTGAGWRSKRTGWSEEIPLRHWHLNDPGVVPNLLQLYAGSPTGILVYEGNLLQGFKNGLVHSEAGGNVVRHYPIRKESYGYTASIVDMMKAVDDPWFRPSDVCVAPDGSIFVSDWYDPGVGGHLVGDQQRGRIFRIAPVEKSYNVPDQDFKSIPGLIEALKSPNQAIRYLAWQGLKKQASAAKPALMELIASKEPIFMARALWLLAELDHSEAIDLASSSSLDDLQITAIRIARQKSGTDLLHFLSEIEKNARPQVRREIAVALRFQTTQEAAAIWTRLAQHYQGDRWFLEALGIGSDLNAEQVFNTWMKQVGPSWNKGHNRDIVWRIRAESAIPLLAELILEQTNIQDTYRYFRAFDFHKSTTKNKAIESVVKNAKSNKEQLRQLAFNHMDKDYVISSPELLSMLNSVIESQRGSEDFLRSIEKYQLKQYNPELMEMVVEEHQDAVTATRLLLKNQPGLLTTVMNGTDEQKTSIVINSLGKVNNHLSLDILYEYMDNESKPLALRQHAARHFATGWEGQNRMLDLLDEQKLAPELVQSAAGSLSNSWRAGIRAEAAKYLEKSPTTGPQASFSQIMELEGEVDAGTRVFEKLCQSCHVVNGTGTDFGPGLSEIGGKLSKEALYYSILNPDAGISFGYEGYLITLADGSKITGLVQSRTESEIMVNQLGGVETLLELSTVQSIVQLENSLMTPNLGSLMTHQELADLISYLDQLENAM